MKTEAKSIRIFFDTAAESLADKAKRFCERIWTEEKDDVCLKKCCEHQIVLFNRLGQIRRRAWWFYKNDYVELFPHAVVLFWIMIEPYIKDRRAMTGGWWARDFEQLTKECLRFILRSRPNATLYLYDRDRKKKNNLEISNMELCALQDRLESRQLRG